MKNSFLLRILCVSVAFVVFSCLPRSVFAQRGGHGGGGGFGGGGFHGGAGFHGGGGGFHGGASFHGGGGHYGSSGGHFYGGYRGGGYYGRGGGYYGWRGGYRGYPRYGYGWGLGFGFGWPYWWGYPYAYGYSPWWSSPYPYYYSYCAPGYPCPYNGDDDPPPANSGPQSENYPPNPSRRPVASGPSNYWPSDGAKDETSAPILSIDRISSPPKNDPVADSFTVEESNAPIVSVDRITATPSSYRVASSAMHEDPALRPEVKNAIRALHEMPPFAREREIETGRYSHFSPEEKKLLRSAN